MSAWVTEGPPTNTGQGAVTLVEGSSFCVCTPSGDLGGREPLKMFFRDTRILAR